jgi:hypothetical protein
MLRSAAASAFCTVCTYNTVLLGNWCLRNHWSFNATTRYWVNSSKFWKPICYGFWILILFQWLLDAKASACCTIPLDDIIGLLHILSIGRTGQMMNCRISNQEALPSWLMWCCRRINPKKLLGLGCSKQKKRKALLYSRENTFAAPSNNNNQKPSAIKVLFPDQTTRDLIWGFWAKYVPVPRSTTRDLWLADLAASAWSDASRFLS